MPEEVPDAGTAERALRGDRAAWDILVARHERRVLLTLLSRGVRVDHAEEIVQETWIKLVAQAKNGNLDRLDLPGLAITQALFLAKDAARRKKAASTSLDDDVARTSRDPSAGVEERLVTREGLERVAAELERCSPRAREVFEVVYQEPDLPHAEAALRVGLSVQRLRQTLCEVRARLRSALET